MARKIKSFDRSVCRQLSQDVLNALEKFCAARNIAIDYKGGSFGPSNATLKFEFAVKDANGDAVTREAQEFETCCTMFGLDKTDLGKTFVTDRDSYRITGLTMRGRRFPILAERVKDGRSFKFPADIVCRALGKKETAKTRMGKTLRDMF